MSEPVDVARPSIGAIAVSGPDAMEFLRAQLTNDVRRLGPDRHLLAAWCDAKGRVVMICRVARLDDGYLLILPSALVASVLKRLQMYVLRAKVTLAEAPDLTLIGCIDDDLPDPGAVRQDGEARYLGLPTGTSGRPRALYVAPTQASAPAGAVAPDSADWQLEQIDAGLPTVQPATQGLFVPQMLNLHWLMAVDFDKGCYPGQEVIARLHYRGRLTRRLFRLAWQGSPPLVGDSVTDADGETAGTVVRTAAERDGAGRLLAVLRVDAVSDAGLACGSAELDLLDLPYATPD